MKKEKEAHEALSLLFHRYGVPNMMVMDGANEQVQGEFRRKLRDAGCHIRQTEPHTQSSNMGEGGVRELKRGVGRQMLRFGCPKLLWDDFLVREAYLRSNTALGIFGLEGQVPESRVIGETANISTIAGCGWYEWGKYRDIGLSMSRKILKLNGQVLYRTFVRSLPLDEIQSPTEIVERLKSDNSVEEKLGKSMLEADFKDDPYLADFIAPIFEPCEDDEVPVTKMPDIDDIDDDHDVDTYDKYVGAQVRVPIGGEICSGKFMRRKREVDGTWKGRANVNPMLDSRTYEIEFPDGRSDEYTANVITENTYAQCDTEGNQFNIMDFIIDHKKYSHALERADMYIKHGSNKQVRKTTKGWHLCVTWKDGTTSWEHLADLKESNPVEIAEYTMGKNL
jgi:hypothetical protein